MHHGREAPRESLQIMVALRWFAVDWDHHPHSLASGSSWKGSFHLYCMMLLHDNYFTLCRTEREAFASIHRHDIPIAYPRTKSPMSVNAELDRCIRKRQINIACAEMQGRNMSAIPQLPLEQLQLYLRNPNLLRRSRPPPCASSLLTSSRLCSQSSHIAI